MAILKAIGMYILCLIALCVMLGLYTVFNAGAFFGFAILYNCIAHGPMTISPAFDLGCGGVIGILGLVLSIGIAREIANFTEKYLLPEDFTRDYSGCPFR